MDKLGKLLALAKRYDALRKMETGPIGTIYEAIGTIIEEACQGSNQACTEPEDDTIWSRTELELFEQGLEPLIALLEREA